MKTKEYRPKLNIELGLYDRFLEITGWLLLTILIVFCIDRYLQFPDTIPVHFNAKGEIDRYGSKFTIFFLPIMGTVLFIGLTILNNYPHIFNYLKPITEENALTQYTLATRLMRILKLTIIFVFLVFSYLTNRAVENNSMGIGVWIVPLTMIIILSPVVYYIIKSVKSK